MSIIVPAGKKNITWSPKEEEKLEKTASTEGIKEQEEQEEVNPVYEAAKNFLETQKPKDEKKVKKANAEGVEDGKIEDKGEEKAMDDEIVTIELDDVEEAEEVEGVEKVEEAKEKSVSEAVKEVEEKAKQAEQKVEAVEEAIEKIEEAVGEVKDVCGDIEGDAKAKDVSEGKEEDVEIPGEEVVDTDIIVESEPEIEACMDKAASSEEEFCKYAKLSPQNRVKLVDYWVNMLGFPKDFVNLMTKDYEK